MRALIAICALLLPTAAWAQGSYGGHGGYYYPHSVPMATMNVPVCYNVPVSVPMADPCAGGTVLGDPCHHHGYYGHFGFPFGGFPFGGFPFAGGYGHGWGGGFGGHGLPGVDSEIFGAGSDGIFIDDDDNDMQVNVRETRRGRLRVRIRERRRPQPNRGSGDMIIEEAGTTSSNDRGHYPHYAYGARPTFFAYPMADPCWNCPPADPTPGPGNGGGGGGGNGNGNGNGPPPQPTPSNGDDAMQILQDLVGESTKLSAL